MSSPAGTPGRRITKRRRSPSPKTPRRPEHSRRNSESSLPPSSSPPPFSDEPDAELSDEQPIPLADDEDDEGEDLFADNVLEEDYTGDMTLDAYDQADIDDDDDVDELDAADRRAVERKLDRRDKAEGAGRKGRRRRALMPDILGSEGMESEDVDPNVSMLAKMKRRTRRMYDERPDEEEAPEDAGEVPYDQLQDIKASSITEWVSLPGVKKTIAKHFHSFLHTYTDPQGDSIYGRRIVNLGEVNSESLEVSYVHLADAKTILAYFLVNSPEAMLTIFDEIAYQAVLTFYPAYDNIHSEIHVRITDLPDGETLRDLRRTHLNHLVRVSGVVTRRSGVFPQLKYVKFDCGKCGAILGPFYQDTQKEVKISFCPNCEGKGPFRVNSEQTVYRNYQKLTLQESPGTVPPGRLPRHREVILLWDLIDSAKPGEEIDVTGIYRNNFDASLNVKNGFPVFNTIIEANQINKKEDLFAAFRLTEEDEKAIRELGRDERIAKRIIKSIAPSIYGHEQIKTALALSLFGGVAKDIKRKMSLRGDINVLLLGDPGTAKSQFLKYVEKTAHRAVFATGQGASAVGLTASVRKDAVTREWTLEGGALVLADKGVCLIDEFDKMNDADRTSIHEAMEQQSISISKAGIVTSLQARCAVIAAANPIRGRYNSSVPFQANVELTEPILSRFDILCVVQDTVDPVADELLAKFVVGSHLRSHPDFDKATEEMDVGTSIDEDLIPQDLLRKYIMYARTRVTPKLHNIDSEKIANLFVDLRRESKETGSFPITVRHLESTLRMAEASARMHLREFVRADDVNLAIKVAIKSFVSAQKTSIRRSLERSFRKYVSQAQDHEELLAFLLGQIVKEKVRMHSLQHEELPDRVTVKVEELNDRAKGYDVYDTAPFLKSKLFKTNGYKLVGDGIEKTFKRESEL